MTGTAARHSKISIVVSSNLWATGRDTDIVVTDPFGTEIGMVTFPGATTNLAWGGKDGKTLFVTTRAGGVYRLNLTVKEAR